MAKKRNGNGPKIPNPPAPPPRRNPHSLEPLGVVPALTWGAWALKHWKLIGFLILLVGAAGVFVYQDIRIKQLKNETKSLQIDVDHWKTESEKCSANFTDLSNRVKAESDRSKVLMEEFDDFKDDIKTIIRNNPFRPAENIRNEPTPKQCTEAINFMRNHLDEMKWQD